MRRARLLIVLAACSCALAFPATAAAGPVAQSAACPAFTVLHNDRIGALSLPAGPYTLKPSGLSCAQAATKFATFLDYPAGLLPSPWRLSAAARRFSNSATGQSFTVSRGGTPPTPPVPPNGRCPGTFGVLHNDRIGALRLPKGPYVIRVAGPLGCTQAATLFAEFLQDYDGILASPWKVLASQRRFAGGTRSFTVTRAGPGRGGNNPTTQRLCPGTFRVLNSDRIGSLKVAKGNYYIWLLPSRTVNCALAYSSFSQFLARTDGQLPRPWVLDASVGTFVRGRTSPPTGFRIDPGTNTGGGTPAG